jgi:hypothetical protein
MSNITYQELLDLIDLYVASAKSGDIDYRKTVAALLELKAFREKYRR